MFARVSECVLICFFFNDTATTEIYTLSLHDALPIYAVRRRAHWLESGPKPGVVPGEASPSVGDQPGPGGFCGVFHLTGDRKSTRLNSSHANISYAVFCLKKKKNVQYALTYERTTHEE